MWKLCGCGNNSLCLTLALDFIITWARKPCKMKADRSGSHVLDSYVTSASLPGTEPYQGLGRRLRYQRRGVEVSHWARMPPISFPAGPPSILAGCGGCDNLWGDMVPGLMFLGFHFLILVPVGQCYSLLPQDKPEWYASMGKVSMCSVPKPGYPLHP